MQEEEIKEILEDMDLVANKNKVPIYYSQNDIKIVLDYITNLQEENERLNNIIDELEKWLEEKQILYGINQQGFSWGVCGEALDKLQELKGDNK